MIQDYIDIDDSVILAKSTRLGATEDEAHNIAVGVTSPSH